MLAITATVLTVLLTLFLMLHILVLLKIISYRFIWGGRLKSEKEMYRFETVSILGNALFLMVSLARTNLAFTFLPPGFVNTALWLMTALFLLNTAGNVLSKNMLEKRLFTPVTLVMAVLSFVLAFAS
jgi:hypothetical protein